MGSKSICVVGGGRWGKNHIRTLLSMGCLGGIVETDLNRQQTLIEELSLDKNLFFENLETALTKNFDGFTVATPAETHVPIAKQIIRSRKHLLVEKPLALNSSDAKELAAMAKKYEVNLMVGHVLLFHPAIKKIKQLIGEGKIGKLQYIYSNRLNLGTVRKEENILWSFAPHDISIFQHFVGTRPSRITSKGGTFIQPGIHDTTMTILEYPGNVTGHIFVSWLHPYKDHKLVLVGSKGMLSFEDSSKEKQLLFYKKHVDLVEGEPITREGATEVVPYDSAMPLSEEIQYFMDSIDSGKVEISGEKSAIEVLEILEEASLGLTSPTVDQEMASAKVAKRSISPEYFVHESSYVDDNVSIGKGTKVWHFSHVLSNAEIGENCSVGQNVLIGSNVKIGNGVKIQNNVAVYEGVELEDYVFCGPSMVFTNVLDPRSKYPQRGSEFYHETLVKEGASLGANCTIVCGNTIGRHAFVAAGAVVTKDVPDYALMVGVPARLKGWVCECGEQLGAIQEVGSESKCSRCGLEYQLESENKLLPLLKDQKKQTA